MLLIDRHETSLLPLLPSGSYETTDLSCDEHGRSADALWLAEGIDPDLPQLVAVERKKLSEAITCQTSGRLIEQIRCSVLCKGCTRLWILIEGDFRPSPHSGILERPSISTERKLYWVPAVNYGRKRYMYASFYNWLSSICQSLWDGAGVQARVWVTHEAKESADWMWSQYSEDQKRERKSLQVFDNSSRPLNNCSECGHGMSKHRKGQCGTCREKCSGQPKRAGGLVRPCLTAEIMAKFDLVGWDRALAMGDYFESARDAANADVGEYLKVDGVGKKTAEGVVRQWNEKRVIK